MEITPDFERGRYSFMCVGGLEVALLKSKKKKKILLQNLEGSSCLLFLNEYFQ